MFRAFPLRTTKQDVLKEMRRWVIMTFGLFINAFAWTAFLIPSKIIGGGLSGISTIIFYMTGIPVGVVYLIINILLVLIAIRILGASFGVKTIFSVLVLGGFLSLLQGLIKEPLVDDIFLSAVLGGLLAGAGIGIVFNQGGSTGGTDIFAMIINKYRNISPGRLILYFDVVIISSSYFVFDSVERLVYGFVTMAIVAWSIDMIMAGNRQSTQIFIFSKYYEEISKELNEHINRGMTLLDAQGWYSREPGKIVLVVTRKHEMPHVLRIIKSIDPDAFISVASVMGTYGKGFENIRG
ncbi:MAG TPA: YitT family protein [Salinivirga sp.]|uniref:YitT family protein n=1 Tax=Salinivirga sp. TaxID=1970192 RepID=UPI002B473262|nr:YitT family protein [Salinivirga sp.]HKK59036.1 YitT family protein [Salinivirga sp.]